jgi:tetratricopeptide (TPR) repeat protein
MPRPPFACVAPALGVVLSVALTASQDARGNHPELPRLALDALPQGVRTSVQAAYDAARAHPRDAAVVGHLAMVLHAYEQYGAADDCYRIARQLAARSLEWTYLSGVVQAELGQHTAAVASLRQALSIDPDYLPARVRLAAELLHAGDLQPSYAEYEALVRDLPELALAHYGLGRVSSLRRDSKAASGHYQRAVDLAPEFGAAHYALALAYRDLDLSERARPHLDAYRRLGARRPVLRDPVMDRVRSMRETARDFLAEAARLGDAGRLEESIAMQVKALEADPRSAQAHVNLIALYGRTGRFDRAESHYRAAIELEGSLGEAHYNYGVLLASARRHEEAASAFRKTLTVDPFHAAAHNNLAALLAQERRFDEAAAHYRQALANDPQHATARFNLGRVLVLLGRPTEAIEQLERALARAEQLGQVEMTKAIRAELQKVK